MILMFKRNDRLREKGIGLMEVIVGVLVALILGLMLLRLFNMAYAKYRLNMATDNIARELKTAKEQAK